MSYKMSLENALELFSLGKNFTKEDLRKAYRNIVKQYHSDNIGNNEKIKDINVIYEDLNRYLNTGVYNSSLSSYGSIQKDLDNRYKNNVIELINEYNDLDKNHYLYNEFKVIILNYTARIELASREEVKNILNLFYNDIKVFYIDNFINKKGLLLLS